jgi:hypothetical protein
MDEQQRDDQLLASAVTFLIDGGDEKAAMILLSCMLSYREQVYSVVKTRFIQKTITLAAPRACYDFLTAMDDHYHLPPEEDDPELPAGFAEKVNICASIRKALHALTDTDVRFVVKASLVQVTPPWRKELLAVLRGETVTNQGLPFSPKIPMVTWNNLRFRSQTEVRVAEAL